TWWQVSYTTGVSGWSAETYLTAASTSSTAPTSIANIPVGEWTAFETPSRNSGVYYGDEPYDGMKHVSMTVDPDNGRIYFEGGDYAGAAGFKESYQQETWSLDLAARLADTTNRNAGWRLEYPYCGPAGQVQPKHPDTVGWVWDSKRHVFWHVTGKDVPSLDLCPGETSGYAIDQPTATTGGFIPNHLMTFNPTTQKWTDVSSNIDGPYGNNWKSVYDPKTDTIIRFGVTGGSGAVASVYDIATNSWTDYGLGSTAQGSTAQISDGFAALDLADRIIYVMDPFHGRLMRYNMDAHTLTDLGPIPGGARGPTGFFETYIAWDSVSKVLLWFNSQGNSASPVSFYAYHPSTGTWETLSTAISGVPGVTTVTGRDLVYDPYDNVLLLGGDVEPVSPHYYFLYRYGNGSGTSPAPSPTPTPQPSTPAPTLSLSASPTTVSSGGSTTLTW
ncbi:MAG: hypothetical protein B7X04_04480, partial [Parcubacteria group bacterium 21-54-25]